MNITLECLPCFVNHTLGVLKEFDSENRVAEKVLRQVLRRMAEIDFNLTPPEFAAEIHSCIRENMGIDDPYQQIKNDSNQLACKLVSKLETKLGNVKDSLRKAVMYSIAGNIIDSGISAVTPPEEILKSIEMAENQVAARDDFDKLEKSLSKSKNILVLGDNAGEVFFDRLLLQAFGKDKNITYAVKSGPILNDATIEDARAAKLNEFATLIENGTRIPGTPLKKVSEEFLTVYKVADLIISKGQANYETLSHRLDQRVFFLLRAKCSVISQKAGVPQGSFLVMNNF
jgi:hypothetical protein